MMTLDTAFGNQRVSDLARDALLSLTGRIKVEYSPSFTGPGRFTVTHGDALAVFSGTTIDNCICDTCLDMWLRNARNNVTLNNTLDGNCCAYRFYEGVLRTDSVMVEPGCIKITRDDKDIFTAIGDNTVIASVIIAIACARIPSLDQHYVALMDRLLTGC